jgi:hypothetical protein
VVDAGSAVEPCVDQAPCARVLEQRGADLLRAGAASAQGAAIVVSPTLSRGSGLVAEVSVQSLAFAGLRPPGTLAVAPTVPFVAVGAVGGGTVRGGGGVYGGGLVPTGRGGEGGFGVGGRAGIAVGATSSPAWVGLEVDGGYAFARGSLVDLRDAAPYGLDFPACPAPCTDTVDLLHAGVDSALAVDVDPTATLFLRLGGEAGLHRLILDVDKTVVAFAGITPRTTAGAVYRPHPNAALGASVRMSLLEPSEAEPRSRASWSASLSAGWRFGPPAAPRPEAAPVPSSPSPVPVPAPRPVMVPKIVQVEHPELRCPAGTVGTGAPPPRGLAAWCVTVDPLGRVILEGPYVEWHDPDRVAARGQHAADLRSGVWTHYDLAGRPVETGSYEEGAKVGVWQTFWPDGAVRAETTFVHGRESGPYAEWSEDRQTVVVGHWANGERDGAWRVFVAERLVSERIYRGGLMISEQRFQ